MVNREDKRREKLGRPAWVELGVPKALRTGLNFDLVFTSVGYRHRQLSQYVMASQIQRWEMSWRL